MNKINREQAEALQSQLDDFFQSLDPADERSELDDFALEQALELESKVSERLHELRQSEKARHSGSSSIVSASSDYLGR